MRKTLLIILAILIVSIIVLWIWNSIVNKSNITADWETYRNEEFGIELKYPKDWIIKNDHIVFKNEKCQLNLFTGHGMSEDWVEERGEIMINSKNYTKIEFSREDSDFKLIAILDLFENFSTELSYYDHDQDCLQEFYQILSTFKFIENDETADWKIYKNEKQEFEFKYPKSMTVIEDEYSNNEPFVDFSKVVISDNNYKDFSFLLAINHPGFGLEMETYKPGESINIDGITGNINYLYSVDNSEFVTDFISWNNRKQNDEYSLIVNFEPKNREEIEKLINQILSTFKFIE